MMQGTDDALQPRRALSKEQAIGVYGAHTAAAHSFSKHNMVTLLLPRQDNSQQLSFLGCVCQTYVALHVH
jgi:hypothetical protein